MFLVQSTNDTCQLLVKGGGGGGGVGLPDRVGLVWSGLTGKGG